MKKTVILIMFVEALLIACFTEAYDIRSFNTEIETYSDGVAKVNHHVIIDSREIDTAFMIPSYSPESVIVNDDDGELKFAMLGTFIIIQPRRQSENYAVRVQYLTDRLTSKNADTWSFFYVIPQYSKMKVDRIGEAGLILSLPITSSISSVTDEGIVFTENNRIKIGWKLDLKPKENTTLIVRYQQMIGRKMDFSKIGFYSLLAVVLIVLLLVCTRTTYCRLSKRLSKGKKDILNTLEKRERDIVSLLWDSDNKIYQSNIPKTTGISKATISRIIRRLENRNIIEIRPAGNTNLIILQDWFVKK